jgi:hypothetical protein
VLVFNLVACSSKVSKELITYINDDMQPLAEQEEELMELYNGVTGDNYTDDIELYDVLEELVPMYNDFIEDVEAVDISSKEIRDVHELYIEAINLQSEAFIGIQDAIEYQDRLGIQDANSRLSKARKLFRQYEEKMQELMKEHNVKIE